MDFGDQDTVFDGNSLKEVFEGVEVNFFSGAPAPIAEMERIVDVKIGASFLIEKLVDAEQSCVVSLRLSLRW